MDHAGRRDRLRAATGDVDALLVTSLTSTRYLTGFTGSHGAVLVTRDADVDRLGTDFRYVTQVESECPGIEVVVDRNAAAALTAYAVSLGVTRLGIEAEHLSVAARDALAAAHPSLELAPVVRRRRGAAHRQGRRRARGARRGLRDQRRRPRRAAPGDPARPHRARDRPPPRARSMLDLGAEAIAFRDASWRRARTRRIPHHAPTDRAGRAGDLLKIDFGALYDGYHADETRTFVVGARSGRLAGRAARPRRGGPAGRARRARGAGDVRRGRRRGPRRHRVTPVTASTSGTASGTASGSRSTRRRSWERRRTGSLADRRPVTVEPGVYLPGRGGVRIEDTLVVRTGGPESLTKTTRELLVL